jgi:hypothetical protein
VVASEGAHVAGTCRRKTRGMTPWKQERTISHIALRESIHPYPKGGSHVWCFQIDVSQA